jgi:hypothetical protein
MLLGHGQSREDEAWSELPGLDEDVPNHELPQHGHPLRRRLLEHADDHVIVARVCQTCCRDRTLVVSL